ncbi:pgi [Symbiodinium necroappetens]|uniref:glucose-6-phosphate isomerase n=1 Tax=Symbiodinium necroappetens TaxID=1628268 RepID=A0A812NYC9_9DINO|nr:pgi [Symbiodinium necroappetens]
MGRFSSWAQTRAAESPKEEAAEAVQAVQEKQLFVVENLQLRSKSNGIRYRCSPDLADKHSKIALFGSRIKGIPYGGCWIQVGSRFLPTHIGGAEVLRPVEEGSAEGVAIEPADDDVKDKLLGQMLFGRSEGDAGYIDQRQLDKSPTRIARNLIRPETSMTDAPLLSVGDGAVYEVLYDRVAIRSAASTTSTTLEIKQKGETLELFEWDPSRKWRRCAADALATTAGWVLLDHPEFGPLVRPKGAPLCARPLEPLCAAAAEAQLGELRRFLNEGLDPRVCDAGGVSALTLAAQADARDCAIHLIEAGAVTTAAAGDAAIRNASSAGTRVLIQALLGHIVEDDAALQDALGDLTLEARLAADRPRRDAQNGTRAVLFPSAFLALMAGFSGSAERILEQLSEAEAQAQARGGGCDDPDLVTPRGRRELLVKQQRLSQKVSPNFRDGREESSTRCFTRPWPFDTFRPRQQIWLAPESWASLSSSSRRAQMESGEKWKMQKVAKRAVLANSVRDAGFKRELRVEQDAWPLVLQARAYQLSSSTSWQCRLDEASQEPTNRLRAEVGHYWLRNPELAPEAFKARQAFAAFCTLMMQEIRKEIYRSWATWLQIWPPIPSQGELPEAQIEDLSHEASESNVSALLLLGIGGSALGPQLVSEALGPGLRRIAFLDNTDPDGFHTVLSTIEPASTWVVLVASKSGGTVETRNALVETKAHFLSHGVDFSSKALAITCAGSRLDGCLLPAALLGMDWRSLLRNPAVLLARAWQSLAGRAMVVLPYRDRLQLFGRYLQQLVMESLGKARNLQGDLVNHGLTVYGNKGSTDQHAILQQLLDGPDDFFVVFIAIMEGVHDKDSKEVETGITSSDYLLAFLVGTRRALTAAGRRSLTITLQRVDAFHLGVLIALFERAVGLYAALIGVNAYNQPAVEFGKQAASDVTPCWPSPWGPYAAGQVGGAPEHPSWSDGLDVYDTDGQHVGTSTAWQAQTSCQWHRTVYVIPRLPDGRILFQRRADWKWRMGGLWDLGASETVEMGEDLQAAAQRAVHEELGSRAALLALTECCRLNTGWSGALPKMQLCQLDQNIVYTAKGSLGADAGDRDEEVDALEYWSLDDYTMQAELDRYKFAPWVHALIVGCPRCFGTAATTEL